MSLTSHPYKTRNQTFNGSIDTSGTTTGVATSENITNLETKLLHENCYFCVYQYWYQRKIQ